MAAPKELMRYHPERYGEAFAELIEAVVMQWRAHSQEDKDKYRGLLGSTIFEGEVEALIEEEPGECPLGMTPKDWSAYKNQMFDAYTGYCNGGRSIVHLQPELLEMFRHTDVSQIKVADLRAPLPSFYLHFGGGIEDLVVGQDNVIDGAYVQFFEQDLFVYVSTRSRSVDLVEEAARSELRALNSDRHLQMQLIAHDEEAGGTIAKAIAYNSDPTAMEAPDRAQLSDWEPHMQTVANIVVNALCFMTSEHNDLNERFTDNTPKSFVMKLKGADSPKHKQRLLSKALAHGFRRVKFLGDTYRRAPGHGGDTAIAVQPHWRRGHWRNQPFGEARLERKLIWIKPTLVNRELGAPAGGRIYDVGATEPPAAS